ncbi:hypothetical protein ACJX0J_031105, partial [Zea mays]
MPNVTPHVVRKVNDKEDILCRDIGYIHPNLVKSILIDLILDHTPVPKLKQILFLRICLTYAITLDNYCTTDFFKTSKKSKERIKKKLEKLGNM